jgi:cytochrome c
MESAMKSAYALIALLCTALWINSADAADRATKAEAEAMVKKAVEFIKANGPEKGYSEISNRQGQFIDRDLYIVVYDIDGKCLAHGANAKLIGKDLSESTDADGKFFVKERMELSKTKANFWQDYKFSNPVDKKIEPKETYCERLDNVAVCGGIYKS